MERKVKVILNMSLLLLANKSQIKAQNSREMVFTIRGIHDN